ncbi:MAG: isochorismatase family cysteine hydrolase [Isosphaeraceae bacterium]
MLPGPLVFVDIDTQRDFLEPTGALYVSGSEAILDNLRRLTEFARSHGVPILASACAHTEEDVEEIARFGRHCMVGSPGQARSEATRWEHGTILGSAEVDFAAEEALPAHLTLEKRDYDVFTHPGADRVIARYNRDHPTFVVYGVATDFCVRAAVLGLLHRDCRVAVVVDAIRAIDGDHEADVLAEFVGAGALLTTTDVVTTP